MVSSSKITLDTTNVEAFDNELPSPVESKASTSSNKQKVKHKDIEGKNFEKSTHYLSEV